MTENTAESIIQLKDASGRGTGTGFVVLTESGKRVIITNAHVCEINLTNPLFTVSGRQGDNLHAEYMFKAVVIKKDEDNDLCMLSVPLDFSAQPLKLADNAYTDSRIYIIGYPMTYLLSSSDGFIRGYQIIDTDYELPLNLCVGKKHYIKTVPIQQKNGKKINKKYCYFRAKMMFADALGEPGQSGSPGLNGDGEVVGVMSMISGQARPFAFLVPLSDLRKFLSTY